MKWTTRNMWGRKISYNDFNAESLKPTHASCLTHVSGKHKKHVYTTTYYTLYDQKYVDIWPLHCIATGYIRGNCVLQILWQQKIRKDSHMDVLVRCPHDFGHIMHVCKATTNQFFSNVADWNSFVFFLNNAQTKWTIKKLSETGPSAFSLWVILDGCVHSMHKLCSISLQRVCFSFTWFIRAVFAVAVVVIHLVKRNGTGAIQTSERAVLVIKKSFCAYQHGRK